MTDYRDELIDTQRRLISAQEATIATLRALLIACQKQARQSQQTAPQRPPRKDVQA